jgi:hypothetical protein
VLGARGRPSAQRRSLSHSRGETVNPVVDLGDRLRGVWGAVGRRTHLLKSRVDLHEAVVAELFVAILTVPR